MKKILILTSAALLVATSTLNVLLLTQKNSAKTSGMVFNIALANGEYMDEPDPSDFPPIDLPPDFPNDPPSDEPSDIPPPSPSDEPSDLPPASPSDEPIIILDSY